MLLITLFPQYREAPTPGAVGTPENTDLRILQFQLYYYGLRRPHPIVLVHQTQRHRKVVKLSSSSQVIRAPHSDLLHQDHLLGTQRPR